MSARRPHSLLDLLFLPLGCLMQIPPLALGIIALVALAIGGYFYYTTNSDFGGLARPAFQNLEVSKDFGAVTSTTDNRLWKITYEYFADSPFSGVVRHVAHWREDGIPFATHDVLVTTEDFANPDRVDTSVHNHRFEYRYAQDPAPKGRINLLHIVPLNEDIYKQLLGLREWDNVTITGREILKIDMFNPDGEYIGYWQDEGCNTILVKSVKLNQ
ncbi:MAG TPA: hypothetical protein VJL59_02740 [Anaerolineales bacterium]|nr:hypothetical protein [Anaerolineales bacterium]